MGFSCLPNVYQIEKNAGIDLKNIKEKEFLDEI